MVEKFKNKKVAFEDLEKTMNTWRNILFEIRDIEYAFADASRFDKGSQFIQERIFEGFYERINNELFETFKANFHGIISQRDNILSRYVPSCLDEIKSWKNNDKLKDVNYIATQAKDRLTGVVGNRIAQIPGYYDEKSIVEIVKDNLNDFAPEFRKGSGKSINKEEIELMSISNLAGLYNLSDMRKGIVPVDKLVYELYSRIKSSHREMIKFIDWLIGLRAFEDYPYDATGLITVVPNNNFDGKFGGEQIYKFGDFLNKSYKKYGHILVENSKSSIIKGDDRKSITIHKLNPGTYDFDNYLAVMHQLNDTEKRITRRRSKEVVVKDYELQMLLQGHQYKHFVEETRAETWIMNKRMHEVYTGELIGHNTRYIAGREQERVAQLNNPVLSDAYLAEEKKRNNGSNIFYSKSGEPCLPSMTIFAKRLEEEFIKIFDP